MLNIYSGNPSRVGDVHVRQHGIDECSERLLAVTFLSNRSQGVANRRFTRCPCRAIS